MHAEFRYGSQIAAIHHDTIAVIDLSGQYAHLDCGGMLKKNGLGMFRGVEALSASEVESDHVERSAVAQYGDPSVRHLGGGHQPAGSGRCQRPVSFPNPGLGFLNSPPTAFGLAASHAVDRLDPGLGSDRSRSERGRSGPGCPIWHCLWMAANPCDAVSQRVGRPRPYRRLGLHLRPQRQPPQVTLPCASGIAGAVCLLILAGVVRVGRRFRPEDHRGGVTGSDPGHPPNRPHVPKR